MTLQPINFASLIRNANKAVMDLQKYKTMQYKKSAFRICYDLQVT
jgi:hypothetical protein